MTRTLQTQGQGHSAIKTLTVDASRVRQHPITKNQPLKTHLSPETFTTETFIPDTPNASTSCSLIAVRHAGLRANCST